MSAEHMRTSPKKARKPQQRTLGLRRAISEVASEYEHMTVRQLFYQLVARGVIEKTEKAYKRVDDHAVQMRHDGTLHYRKIADGARMRREPWVFDGLSEALSNTYAVYRRNYWLDQAVHVEVWCEKDALTGVIHPVCDRYGVAYIATRGFASITLIYESAQAMIESGKPTHIYYFGDHDPSGRCMSENLQADLRAHGADVTVYRMALEPDQIARNHLPTRPSKKSDSRHAAFAAEYGTGSVELDALPPDMLENLVAWSIEQDIDQKAWARMRLVETEERRTLGMLAYEYDGLEP